MKTFDRFAPLRTPAAQCVVAEDRVAVLAPRLGEIEWPDFEVVKRSTVRTVARGVLGHGEDRLEVWRKLYRAVTLSDRARDALSGSRGMRELLRLDEARARGIPCVRPIAAGRFVGSFGARSFLVTDGIRAEPMPRANWSEGAAEAAGRLLRRAHDQGLHAPDLHPGNLLLAPDGGAVLCDLTSAILANPLEFEQRARALAYFCRELDGLAHDPAARPLLSAYGASPRLADEAFRCARRLRNRALNAFERRATRPCRHTEVEIETTKPAARWYLHVPAADLHDEARAFARRDDAEPPAKHGRRGSVHVSGGLVIKQRPASAARRLFRAAYAAIFAGVPIPRPVALRLGHGTGQVFFERLPEPDLAEAYDSLTDDQRRDAAVSLGRSMARLHAFGLRNRDAKFENLVHDPESGTTYMVDLDGVRRRKPIETRGRARDLGRILAAYRVASRHAPEPRLLRAFLVGYHRTSKCLGLSPNLRLLLRHTEERASEWANAHPSTRAS